MANGKDPLRLNVEDLFTPKVEAYLEEQQIVRRPVPEAPPQPLLKRIFLASWFYLAVAGGLGAFLAWMALEPFISEGLDKHREANIALILIFPTIAASIALLLGLVEGLMCRNPARAFTNAAVGLGVGLVGGCVAIFAGGIIFGVTSAIAISMEPNLGPGGMPRGFAFLVLMMGRAASWSVAAIPAGLGQGVALRDKKIALNGLLGGVLGGLIGGMAFDPLSLVFLGPDGTAGVSRAVGFTVIGLMVGLFVGLVEQWTKTAWVVMKAGALAGKQFVLYRNPTVLGSSPKADVYLFKDQAIEPQHALIHNRGGRYELEDCKTPDGTYVNGIPVKRRYLENGDQIVLGKTVLEFSLRDAAEQ